MRIPLIVTESLGITRTGFPVTRGVPLPERAVRDAAGVSVLDSDGIAVPFQARPLLRWPDGSIQTLLVDFQASVPAHGRAEYGLVLDAGGGGSPPPVSVVVEEAAERVTVSTGVLRFAVSRRRFSVLEWATLGRQEADGTFTPEVELVSPEAGGEAFATICECFPVDDTRRRIYGLGGECLASLASDDYRVSVEESGPLRVVIRCDGKLEAVAPAGHYGGYRPLHFTLRLHAYAGQPFLRALFTFVFAANPRETEVEEIGLRIPLSVPGGRRARLGMRREMHGTLGRGEGWLLSQKSDRHCVLDRRRGERVQRLAEDARGENWVALEGDGGGVAVGLRWMAEEYPKALGIPADGGGVDVYLWRDPEGRRLSFRRSTEEVHWGQGEGIYADGTGVAKTSEFFLHFYARAAGDPRAAIRGLLQPPHLAVDPSAGSWCRQDAGAPGFGGRGDAGVPGSGGRQDAGVPGAAPELPPFPRAERMLAGYVGWMTRHVGLGRWYGCLDFGDMRATWEADAGEWRFHGRWGWCNSEWDPRHAFWVQYARTGDPELFALAEAFTRHSTDVDTCHWHPVRPYFVGGCYRHSVDHFGDEPCASHTFVDNWLDHYAATGDGRTLDVLKEAGEFFLRFRWTEDPRFSFSLRTTGNTLRGLLIVWEVTGDESYLRRAETLYETIARAQNPDGSWNKRYQVSTPDRQPDQRPYGMATEGTTWAVELGAAPPFTHGEYRELWGARWQGDAVLPDAEQRGYQTHYLMIGLERLHRITRRSDVAAVYVRAVDWFCGGPDRRNSGEAWRHVGCGILCRHLAYAWRLSGDRAYLEIGRDLLRRLVEQQNWSDDPRFRGALGMSPTDLSYCLFGVPSLLDALHAAGMDE